MSLPMEGLQHPNLHPERRQQRPPDQNPTDSSPYFMPSLKNKVRPTGVRKVEIEERDPEDTNKPTKPRQRQGVLAFANDGKLLTKKPLVNPVPRDDPRRKTLAEVAQETILILPGLLATRPDISCESYLCRRETLNPTRCPNLQPTKVRVIDSDTIDAALSLPQSPSAKPIAILNMANATHAGGGWLHGALAQEEALCYRTSLSRTLHKHHYPIPDDAALYSPTILIIRDNLSSGHSLLDLRTPAELPTLSVISAAAVCQPPLKTTTDASSNRVSVYRDQRDVNLMLEKMRVVLRTAIRNKHRQIVLGAFGCGAFGNPNRIVAEMWKAVLLEKEFQGGYWRDLVFAVLDGKGVSNFDVFKGVLHGLVV